MSMFKKPYEREAKQTLNILIYGRPGIGKTTLACSAPGAFLMDFDRGIDRVDTLYQAGYICEPERWEDVKKAINDLANTPEAKTIVIDTVGRLLDLAVDYVRRTKPNLIQNDGTPNQKGYVQRNQLFKEFLSSLNAIGKSVVFVAHETEDKQKINREEVTTMRPNITGSNRNEIVQDLDLMGYMMMIDNKRTITFDQNDNIIAKNSRNIHGQWDEMTSRYMPIEIPMLNGGENTFLADVVFAGNEKYLAERREFIEKYNEVMEIVNATIDECKDADTLNEAIKKFGGMNFKHKGDSSIRAKKMLTAKAKELGYKYNAETKQYEKIQDKSVAAE